MGQFDLLLEVPDLTIHYCVEITAELILALHDGTLNADLFVQKIPRGSIYVLCGGGGAFQVSRWIGGSCEACTVETILEAVCVVDAWRLPS
jgi:hypothetical protein